jgi:hypothetical protein
MIPSLPTSKEAKGRVCFVRLASKDAASLGDRLLVLRVAREALKRTGRVIFQIVCAAPNKRDEWLDAASLGDRFLVLSVARETNKRTGRVLFLAVRAAPNKRDEWLDAASLGDRFLVLSVARVHISPVKDSAAK